MSQCICCDNTVLLADPFETGRCEDCFVAYMERPENRGLTHAQYWHEERQSRVWYGESHDDKLRKRAQLAAQEESHE